MLSLKYSFLFFILCVAQVLQAQSIKINEFMASNSFVVSDNYSEYEDWVELYNPTNEDIDMAGMWVTDNLNNPLKWQIPAGSPVLTTIQAGDYLIIWFDKDTLQGPTHANSGLKRKGEQIGIYDENLNVLDTLTYSKQEKNISYGRFPDGGNEWHFFNEPTPNATNNNATPYDGFVKGEPLFSIQRGFYDSPQSLVLSQTFTSGDIRYTVDGSKPDENSTIYSSPITIDNNLVVRAAVFQENLIPSKIKTHSFFVNYDLQGRKLPVVALSSKNYIFWNDSAGLFQQIQFVDWEYETNIEFFENNGEDKFSNSMGVETHEFSAWEIPQKPLLFNGRDEFGKKNINYRLFPELNLSSFRNFTFSNTNKDWGNTLLKDYLAQSIAPKNFLDQQFKRATSVFFDQEYLGLYSLEAPLDGRYFANQFQLDKDSIDIIFQNGGAFAGTPQQYFELQAQMQNTDYSVAANYNQLIEQIDVDSYIDYISTLLFCGNNQYATQNTWMWKPQNQGKWRWILKGMNEAFSMDNTNFFDFYTDENGGMENPDWSTLFFRKLLENDSFKQKFLSKFADHLYVTFHPNNTITKLNGISDQLQGEMGYQIPRWADGDNPLVDPLASSADWLNNIATINNFLNNRSSILYTEALDFFDEVNATSTLNLNVVDEGDGEIFIHHLFVTEGVWSGEYFNDIPITLTAVPAEGFTFVEWQGVVVDDPTQATITFTMNANLDIQAVFEPNPTYEFDVVINEIKYQNDTLANLGDWVELYNNSSEMIDLSGWKLDDGSNYFLFPANFIIQPNSYFIVAADQLKFTSYYSETENQVLGNLPFGFSNHGETLTLLDNHGMTRDFVDYKDSYPWPENVDYSIELIAPYLDNNQGKNWIASNNTSGSPLAINTADRLHLGNVPDQEINVGESFAVIELSNYLFSPNTSIENLTWESAGNENIDVTFNPNEATVTLTYNNWQGVEEIVFTVIDSLGQTSNDTSLFLVGTVIDETSICDETFTLENSPYLIKNSLDIASGCYLHVEGGSVLRFEDEAEITCEGELIMDGNENQHITLRAYREHWKDVFINQTDDVALFNYCDVSGATFGTDSVKQNAALAGYYSEMNVINCFFDQNLRSVYCKHGKLLVDSCYFTETNLGEKVNAQFTDATTQNSYLEYTYGDNDAIDYDATDVGLVKNNIILGTGDDGVDIGQNEGVACDGVIVEYNKIYDVFDKSVSVGEGSQNINIHHNLMVGSTYGVSVKDSSTAVIDHCTIDHTRYGVACFQKNIGLGGGIATLSNSIITQSSSTPLFVDETSSIIAAYIQTDDVLASGDFTFVAAPYYMAPDEQNYSLTSFSPAVDKGDPEFALDPDGSRSDLGAFALNKNTISDPLQNNLLIYPNPSSGSIVVSIKNGTQSQTTIQIFTLDGQLVWSNTFLPTRNDIFLNDYFQLNLKNLVSGYYLIRLVQDDRTFNGNFMLLHPTK